LLGVWNAVIDEGDTFTHNDRVYKITQIHECPEYESKGDVVRDA
jgi:hypothetical protein